MDYRLFVNKYWFFRYKILFINKPKLINKLINQPINKLINKPINEAKKNTQLCKLDMSERQNIDYNNNNNNNNNNIKNIKTNSIYIRQIREFRP